MSEIEIWLLGIALAMDCFTVSIAAGIAERGWKSPMSLMALSFGFFQGGMTLLGYLGISTFSTLLQDFDHWIAFALLSYLGVRMILESKKPEEEKTFDLMNIKTILTMSIATSIDALAVGISFGCIGDNLGMNIWHPVWVIALCSSVFTIFGLRLGISLGRRITFPVEAIGGLVLIGIGIKIIIEHTII